MKARGQTIRFVHHWLPEGEAADTQPILEDEVLTQLAITCRGTGHLAESTENQLKITNYLPSVREMAKCTHIPLRGDRTEAINMMLTKRY